MQTSSHSQAASVAGIGAARPAVAVRGPAITRHTIYRIYNDQAPHLTTGLEAEALWRRLLDPVNDYVAAHYTAYGATRRRRFWVRASDHELDTAIIARETLDPDGLVRAHKTLLCTLQDAADDRPAIRLRLDFHSDFFTITQIVDAIPPGSPLGRAISELESPASLDALYTGFWEDRPGRRNA